MAAPLPVLGTASRDLTDRLLVGRVLGRCLSRAVELGAPGIRVVEGGARGGDDLMHRWAVDHGQAFRRVPANWPVCDGPDCTPGHRRRNRRGSYCPTAGHRRNQVMVDLAVELGAAGCVAFLVAGLPCDGTKDCARRAEAAGIPVRFYEQVTR